MNIVFTIYFGIYLCVEENHASATDGRTEGLSGGLDYFYFDISKNRIRAWIFRWSVYKTNVKYHGIGNDTVL